MRGLVRRILLHAQPNALLRYPVKLLFANDSLGHNLLEEDAYVEPVCVEGHIGLF